MLILVLVGPVHEKSVLRSSLSVGLWLLLACISKGGYVMHIAILECEGLFTKGYCVSPCRLGIVLVLVLWLQSLLTSLLSSHSDQNYRRWLFLVYGHLFVS